MQIYQGILKLKTAKYTGLYYSVETVRKDTYLIRFCKTVGPCFLDDKILRLPKMVEGHYRIIQAKRYITIRKLAQ